MERWTVVRSDGTDPWVVGLQAPPTLVNTVFRAAAARAGTPLNRPVHAVVPLVMRTEFDEALQGAFGLDSIERLAHDTGIDTEVLEPVCLASRRIEGRDGTGDVYFVPFESHAFPVLRGSLIPDHPEQAGVGEYDPQTLPRAVLLVGATTANMDEYWNLRGDLSVYCIAPITTP
jgi:hypothetical protein